MVNKSKWNFSFKRPSLCHQIQGTRVNIAKPRCWGGFSDELIVQLRSSINKCQEEEREDCYRLCDLGSIALVFGGIKVLEKEEEQLLVEGAKTYFQILRKNKLF